jgi:hypothetical protein
MPGALLIGSITISSSRLSFYLLQHELSFVTEEFLGSFSLTVSSGISSILKLQQHDFLASFFLPIKRPSRPFFSLIVILLSNLSYEIIKSFYLQLYKQIKNQP